MTPKGLPLAFSYLKRYRTLVVLNLAVLLLLSATEVVGVGMVIPLLQSLAQDHQPLPLVRRLYALFEALHIEVNLWTLLGIFSVVVAFRYLLQALQQYLARLLSSRVTRDLRQRLFHKLLTLPLAYYYRRKTGELVATVYQSALKAGLSLEFLVLSLAAVVVVLALVVLSFALSVRLTLLAGGLAGGVYLLVIPRIRAAFARGRQAKDVEDRLTSFLVETLEALKLVKAMGREELHRTRFNSLSQQAHQMSLRLQRNRVATRLMTEPLVFLLALGLIGVSVGVLQQPLTLVITFFFILFRILPQFRLISHNYVLAAEFLPHFSRIEEVLQAQVPMPASGDRPIQHFQREISFDRVHFRYPGSNEAVLRGVDFRIPRGSVVALFGPSGEGKTTVVDLLLRFHDPTQGHIWVDGADLRTLRIEDWRKLIGLVPQEGFVFHDTVWNNLRYGNPEATEEEILRAVRLAGAHTFLQRLPQGYDTVLGERGAVLSGGQKQRLALARALVRDPEILILDEATSALDSEAEAVVRDVVARFRGQKTVLIVAHRFSTIMDADEIVVLSRGRVVGRGTHQELLEQNELYRRNYELQVRQTLAEGPSGVYNPEPES